jgi:hypothetical protein
MTILQSKLHESKLHAGARNVNTAKRDSGRLADKKIAALQGGLQLHLNAVFISSRAAR